MTGALTGHVMWDCRDGSESVISHLYDAGAIGPHRADHVDVGRGGGAMPLQGLAIGPRYREAEGRGGGQEAQPVCRRKSVKGWVTMEKTDCAGGEGKNLPRGLWC